MGNVKNRASSAVKTGAILLTLNILIGGAKLAAGIVSGSISVASDAANNLGDAAASALLIAAFLLSKRAADKEHPQGHGRYEYISGLLFGIAIVFVGAEFFSGSIKRLIKPEVITLSTPVFLAMAVSIIFKSGMFFFARLRENKYKSGVFKAVAADSLSDIIITLTVLISLFIQKKTQNLYIDAVVGLAVSVFIIVIGVKVLSQTVGRLLGQRADSKLIKKIWELITSQPGVLGAHDLFIHDYGAENLFATAHIVVESTSAFKQTHALVEGIEQLCKQKLGVNLLLHCDPNKKLCSRTNHLQNLLNEYLSAYKDTTAHDVEIVGEKAVFHITMPEKYESDKEKIIDGTLKVLESQGLELNKEIVFDIIY